LQINFTCLVHLNSFCYGANQNFNAWQTSYKVCSASNNDF